MGRVAVDFGVGQGAKRSADIRSDLGQASNAGQHQNQRNPGGRDPLQYFNSLQGEGRNAGEGAAGLPKSSAKKGAKQSAVKQAKPKK